jgi:1,4-alpha-glucan branching enzyme
MATSKKTAVKSPKAEVAPKETKSTSVAKTMKKITFSLPKEAVETAETVAVLGEFNGWDVKSSFPLKKQKDGSFKTTLALESGKEYQYRFIINGEQWENAWDAPKYVSTPFGVDNSVVLS